MSSTIKFSFFVSTTLLVILGQGYSYPLIDLYDDPNAYYYSADSGMSIYDNYDYPPSAGMYSYEYPAAAGMVISKRNYDDNTAFMLDDDGFENQSTVPVDPSSELTGRSAGIYPNQRTKRNIWKSIVRYGRPIYRWGTRAVNAWNIAELPYKIYKTYLDWWNN